METESTREKIKAAAAAEFIEKSFHGARMQSIADRAKANKAMIYYYFHSKEALFEAIIRETFEELFSLFSSEIRSDAIPDPETLIRGMVHKHMGFLAEHPHLPKLLVREMHTGQPIAARVFRELFQKLRKGLFPDFDRIIQSWITAGKIRNVDSRQVVWNIVSLNIFYFMAKPFLEAGWPEVFDSFSEDQIIERREEAVADLLVHGLVVNP